MRISDLSRTTGIPIATIKFYLREGLLQSGTRTGRNQARYGEAHRRRLLFVRALTTVGQLDLTSVRTLLAAIDDGLEVADLHDVVHQVLFPTDQPSVRSDNLQQASDDTELLLKGLSWHVRPDAPGRAWLALVLATLRDLGCDCDIDYFRPYAEAAQRIATQELDLVPAGAPADGAAVMVRSILLAVAFSAMRVLAEEHVIALRSVGTT